MTPEMNELLIRALNDEEFCEQLKKSMPLIRKPNIYSSVKERAVFTYLYAGYHIGKQSHAIQNSENPV